MDKESVERLRFDRRLQQRREWIDANDYNAHLASLPDTASKLMTGADEEAAPAPPSSSASAQPPTPAGVSPVEPRAPQEVPVAGDFSTPGTFSAGGVLGGGGSGRNSDEDSDGGSSFS